MPLVSIVVIDYKKNNPLLVECLDRIQKQSYKNFETILLTDYSVNLKYPKLRRYSYGKYVGPARKRDDGVKKAKGQIVALIDDDAYPAKDWLKYMVENFKDPEVAAVGGPGITPPGVCWKEEASGWICASPVGAGPYTYRFYPGKRREIDDYPSMNLAVRKSDFLKVGGFDSNYWPGEDTKLCLDLVHKLGKKIIYDPEVLVYHHRRPLWRAHLIQHGNFGIHRGYFARTLPKTSARLSYFAPTILLVGLVYLSGLLVFQWVMSGRFSHPYFRTLGIMTALAFAIYCFVLVLNALWIVSKSKKILIGVVSIPGILVTHLWYGTRFIQGFISSRKVENSNLG